MGGRQNKAWLSWFWVRLGRLFQGKTLSLPPPSHIMSSCTGKRKKKSGISWGSSDKRSKLSKHLGFKVILAYGCFYSCRKPNIPSRQHLLCLLALVRPPLPSPPHVETKKTHWGQPPPWLLTRVSIFHVVTLSAPLLDTALPSTSSWLISVILSVKQTNQKFHLRMPTRNSE